MKPETHDMRSSLAKFASAPTSSHNGSPAAIRGRARFASSIADQYRRVADFYDTQIEYIKTLPSFHVGYEYATELLLAMVSQIRVFDKRTKVLELCCGLGTTIRSIASRYGCNLVGWDISQRNVDECNRRTRSAGLAAAITAYRGNVVDLADDRGGFDLILCEDSFSHIPERGRLLQRCYELLNAGGVLAFSDLINNVPLDHLDLVQQYDAWCLWPLETTSSYQQLLHKVGFRIQIMKTRMGAELVAKHIELDRQRGDVPPCLYRQYMQERKTELVRRWGDQLYQARLERLNTYDYLLNGKLDYVFIACQRLEPSRRSRALST